MKKFVTTILAILYMVTSTGASVTMHYCMGKLVGQDFSVTTQKTCSKCGMEKSEKKSNHCCKDEHKHIKVVNDQQLSGVAFYTLQATSTALPVFFIVINTELPASIVEDNPTSNGPPLVTNIPLYKRNCVFRI